jgi:hypothetical protein
MNPDQKSKVILMTVALMLALAGFGVVFYFINGQKSVSQTAGAQPTSPTPAPVAPNTPGTQLAGAAPLAPKVAPPSVPGVLPAPAPIMTALPDPFDGAPRPLPPPPPPPPPPPQVKVMAIPRYVATADKRRRPVVGLPQQSRFKEPPVGRHAGWIYNVNGQVVAIFEDNTGTARAVHVGDDLGGWLVKAIAPDYLLLVDQNGHEQKLKLQGLDTYQGKSRELEVEAGAGMPAWGGGGPPR